MTLMRTTLPSVRGVREIIPVNVTGLAMLLPSYAVTSVVPSAENIINFLGIMMLLLSEGHPSLSISFYRKSDQIGVRDIFNVTIRPFEIMPRVWLLDGVSCPLNEFRGCLNI